MVYEMQKKPELLLPAGSLDALETAFLYGADAVYAGLPSLSLRAHDGFSDETLLRGIETAHRAGKKIYLALNLFSRNEDAENFERFAERIGTFAPDGLIVSDPGVFVYMKKHLPTIPLHVSTQANVGSWMTAEFWKDLGASMCVLSRETPFSDICEIKRRCKGLKIEMFIHGAMCMSYSGRCLLSAYMAGRSANRGRCAHACRWEYNVYLEEKERPGELMPLYEDERGTYIMNSKDLCLMPKLDRILAAGIDCLKVEGRNKTPYYVAVTARAYRKAIDDWFENPQSWMPAPYMAELEALQNRGYTLGFFDGVTGPEQQNYDSTQSTASWRNAGVIRERTERGFVFTIYQKLCAGDVLTFLCPDAMKTLQVSLPYLTDAFTGRCVETISPGKAGQAVILPYDFFKESDAASLPVRTVARIPARENK